jgi:exonuclease III
MINFYLLVALGQYTYWSVRSNARPVNKGLRLDYFVVSRSLLPNKTNEEDSSNQVESKALQISDSNILFNDCIGSSDHCPILLDVCV